MLKISPPPQAAAYTEDDVDRDRVMLAYADLHRAMRALRADAKWDVKMFRTTQSWDAIKQHYAQSAAAHALAPASDLSANATGYQRAAWLSKSQGIAIAGVSSAQDGFSLLVVLTQDAPR